MAIATATDISASYTKRLPRRVGANNESKLWRLLGARSTVDVAPFRLTLCVLCVRSLGIPRRTMYPLSQSLVCPRRRGQLTRHLQVPKPVRGGAIFDVQARVAGSREHFEE